MSFNAHAVPRKIKQVIIAAVALLSFSGWSFAELKISPYWSHNMVLMKNAEIRISGVATPGAKVAASYKGIPGSTSANKNTGIWSLHLDLSGLKDTAPGVLEITETHQNQKQSIVFTNVAVGVVWLVGTVAGQGMPADPNRVANQPPVDRARIRFVCRSELSVDDLQPFRENIPAWRMLSDYKSDQQSWNILSHEMAPCLGNEYVGIIQTTSEAVKKFALTMSMKRSPRRDETSKCSAAGVAAANAQIRVVAERVSARRIEAKHTGIITGMPIPKEYDTPRVAVRTDFVSPDKLPVVFEGALW